MGRLTTNLAAILANADNLPPTREITPISLWDALLPKAYSEPVGGAKKTEKKPLDPNVGMRVYREFYDVKKDKNGNRVMIGHKTPNGSKVNGNGGGEEGKKNGGGNGGGKNGGNGGEKKNGGGGGGDQKPADEAWTAEQDAKLTEMKTANKSWKEIMEAVNKGKSACQDRWKEIKPDEAGGGGGAADVKKDDGGKKDNGGDQKAAGGGGRGGAGEGGKKPTKAEKKAAKAAAAGEDADKQAAPAAKPDKAVSPNNGGKKALSKAGSAKGRFTIAEWRTLQEDDIFSFGELQCLSELIMRDEQQRWLRVAGMFYDKTGRRVHAEDVREKFERMAGGGGRCWNGKE